MTDGGQSIDFRSHNHLKEDNFTTAPRKMYYAAPADGRSSGRGGVARLPVAEQDNGLSMIIDPIEQDVRMPSSVDRNVWLAGILTQKNPVQRSPKLTVILHGILSHKNQSYHRQLAARLPMDSFRFDFRGNGSSGGAWGIDKIGQDVQDLIDVCTTLKQHHGYLIEMIVGHSRGSLAAWTYLARCEQLRMNDMDTVPFYVSVSARWDMRRILDSSSVYNEKFEKDGVYRWTVKANGQPREYKIYPHELQRAATFPIQGVLQRFPTTTDVLLIHGTKDKTVPVQDCRSYLQALHSLPGRKQGSAQMHLVEGGDHMLRGCYDQVVDRICTWYMERTSGQAPDFQHRSPPPSSPPQQHASHQGMHVPDPSRGLRSITAHL